MGAGCASTGTTRSGSSALFGRLLHRRRPALRVTLAVLLQDLLERLVQIDTLLVCDDDQYEHDVCQLQREVLLRFVRLLDLVAEAVVHLPGELADFLYEAGEIGERRPVALLEARDPRVDAFLGLLELHQGTNTTFPKTSPASSIS